MFTEEEIRLLEGILEDLMQEEDFDVYTEHDRELIRGIHEKLCEFKPWRHSFRKEEGR